MNSWCTVAGLRPDGKEIFRPVAGPLKGNAGLAPAEDGAVEEDVFAAGEFGVEAGADFEQRGNAALSLIWPVVGVVTRERSSSDC